MSRIIIPCIIVSFSAEIIKSFLKSNKLNFLLDTLAGIFILAVFISFFTNNIPKVTEENKEFTVSNDDYSYMFENTKSDLIKYAESNIQNTLIRAIKKEFGIEPLICKIEINESMAIEKAELFFYQGKSLISNQAIKTFVKSNYDIDVEVMFI